MKLATWLAAPFALMLAGSCSAGIVLAVDIGVADPAPSGGASPNAIQSGFQGFSAAHQFNLGDRDQNNVGVLTLSRNIGGFDVDLVAPDVNGGLFWDFAADVNGPLGDLAEDVLTAFRSDIVLDVRGLSAGSYHMTTWHHVVIPPSAVREFDILLSTGGGAETRVASNVSWSDGISPAAISSANFDFTIGSGETLRVRLDSLAGATTALNGFRISSVPEPTSLVSVALTALCWLGSRSRSRALSRLRG